MHESVSVLDAQFGEWTACHFSHALSNDDKAILQRIATAASLAVSLKHTCLNFDVVSRIGEPLLETLLRGIKPRDVQRVIASTDQSSAKPLVCSIDGKRVWLQKYVAFEKHLADSLLKLSSEPIKISSQQKQSIAKLFDEKSAEQRAAAELALSKRLAIITGGPGTGKTWTVARLLVLLLENDADCRILLAAPTGKAGARMKESLNFAFQHDEFLRSYKKYLEKLPQKASTLDGLLKINSRISPKPRMNAQNPLACDVLIVDEASMISSPMMCRLLDALPTHARLILLGDKDQLASVEAGSVLGDICSSDSTLHSSIARITHSWRFDEGSEIGVLARSLNAGRVGFAATDVDVKHHVLTATNPWQPDWLDAATQGYAWIKEALQRKDSVQTVLQQQTQFQVLCALREGPFGVTGINALLANSLGVKADGWYAGRPVMITQNDHARHLYNGDVGMVLPVNEQGELSSAGKLKACFWVDGAVKAISVAQMPPHETCYAITVHKSQGSEYRHVMIVLPADVQQAKANVVLSRELIYTAVTRAKEKIDVWAGEGVLEVAAARTTERMSGLLDLLC